MGGGVGVGEAWVWLVWLVWSGRRSCLSVVCCLSVCLSVWLLCFGLPAAGWLGWGGGTDDQGCGVAVTLAIWVGVRSNFRLVVACLDGRKPVWLKA
jgi:hypothetical protein